MVFSVVAAQASKNKRDEGEQTDGTQREREGESGSAERLFSSNIDYEDGKKARVTYRQVQNPAKQLHNHHRKVKQQVGGSVVTEKIESVHGDSNFKYFVVVQQVDANRLALPAVLALPSGRQLSRLGGGAGRCGCRRRGSLGSAATRGVAAGDFWLVCRRRGLRSARRLIHSSAAAAAFFAAAAALGGGRRGRRRFRCGLLKILQP